MGRSQKYNSRHGFDDRRIVLVKFGRDERLSTDVRATCDNAIGLREEPLG